MYVLCVQDEDESQAKEEALKRYAEKKSKSKSFCMHLQYTRVFLEIFQRGEDRSKGTL